MIAALLCPRRSCSSPPGAYSPSSCSAPWQLALGVLLGLLFIINQGLWKETVETLALVIGAAAASMAIGVPLGICRGASANGSIRCCGRCST